MSVTLFLYLLVLAGSGLISASYGLRCYTDVAATKSLSVECGLNTGCVKIYIGMWRYFPFKPDQVSEMLTCYQTPLILSSNYRYWGNDAQEAIWFGIWVWFYTTRRNPTFAWPIFGQPRPPSRLLCFGCAWPLLHGPKWPLLLLVFTERSLQFSNADL